MQKNILFLLFLRDKKNAKDQPTQYIKKQCTKKGGGGIFPSFFNPSWRNLNNDLVLSLVSKLRPEVIVC